MNTYKAVFTDPAKTIADITYVFEESNSYFAHAHLNNYIMNKPLLAKSGMRLKNDRIELISRGIPHDGKIGHEDYQIRSFKRLFRELWELLKVRFLYHEHKK